MRVEYGTVNDQGVKQSGSDGWKSRKANAKGQFLIDFQPGFTNPPSVVVTELNPDATRTRANAVVLGIDGNEAKIMTGDDNGQAAYRAFCFVAMGGI